MPKSHKIQIKKSSLLFRQAAFLFKSNKLYPANVRLPAQFYPAGHHKLLVFLRFICLIILILDYLFVILSSKKQKLYKKVIHPSQMLIGSEAIAPADTNGYHQ